MATQRLTARFSQIQMKLVTHRLTVEDSLSDHRDAFEVHCKVKELSKFTLNTYLYQINSLIEFCRINNITKLSEVNKMVIELFLGELKKDQQ